MNIKDKEENITNNAREKIVEQHLPGTKRKNTVNQEFQAWKKRLSKMKVKSRYFFRHMKAGRTHHLKICTVKNINGHSLRKRKSY